MGWYFPIMMGCLSGQDQKDFLFYEIIEDFVLFDGFWVLRATRVIVKSFWVFDVI